MTVGPVRLDVTVTYAVPRTGVPSAVSFRKWVAAALHNRIREADLAVRIVGTKEARALTRHSRGKDYATNVLSFPAELPDGLPKGVRLPLLGDLVICAPVVAREAKEQKKLPEQLAATLPKEQFEPTPVGDQGDKGLLDRVKDIFG